MHCVFPSYALDVMLIHQPLLSWERMLWNYGKILSVKLLFASHQALVTLSWKYHFTNTWLSYWPLEPSHTIPSVFRPSSSPKCTGFRQACQALFRCRRGHGGAIMSIPPQTLLLSTVQSPAQEHGYNNALRSCAVWTEKVHACTTLSDRTALELTQGISPPCNLVPEHTRYGVNWPSMLTVPDLENIQVMSDFTFTEWASI